MRLRMMRSAAACLAVLAAVVSSHPVFAEEGGPPPVTAQTPVVLWGSAAEAVGTHLSAATFELPVGTRCHVAEAREPAPLWSCALGESTVSGFARRAAFTKQGVPRADPKSAFWERLGRYREEWDTCMRSEGPSESCGKALKLRLNLFWAARSAEAPVAAAGADSGVRTIQCPHDSSNPKCVANVCEGECFSQHLGEGLLVGGTEGAVFLQQGEKDTWKLSVVTSEFDNAGRATKTIAPPVALLDPMLTPLLRKVEHPAFLDIAVDADRSRGMFVEVSERSSRLRTVLRLDGRRPFVVCDGQIVRPTLKRPARILFDEQPVPDLLFPLHEYTLPCASTLVLGEDVPGIRAGAKSAGRFGTPPRMTRGSDEQSLSVGALTLRGEIATELARTLRSCTVELEGVPEGHYTSCHVGYAGDLNGDGKEDFVIDLRGEAGCGGATLFLSSPTGWKYVAGNTDYC